MDEHVFTIGPAEVRRHLMGMRLGQIYLTAVACLLAFLATRLTHGIIATLSAVLVIALGLIAAWLPLRRYAADQWIAIAWSFLVAKVSLARPLRATIDEAGIVHCDGVATVYLELTFSSIALEDSALRLQRTTAFASALTATLSTHRALRELSWTLTTQARDPREASARWVRRHAHDAPISAKERYADLLQEGSLETLRQRIVVSLSSSPWDSDVLVAAARSLGSALQGCAVSARVLSAHGAQSWLRELTGATCERDSCGLKIESAWGHARIGEYTLTAFWLERFPIGFFGPDLLGDLCLLRSDLIVRVSISVAEAASALRSVRAKRTGSIAEGELRQRAGFLASTKAEQEEMQRHRREQRYAQGEDGVRVSVIVVQRDKAPISEDVAKHLQSRGMRVTRCNGEHGQVAAMLLSGQGMVS